MPHTTHLLKSFKTTVTDANPDYIGSLTLPQQLCNTNDLYARQLVHIRVTESGTELWTYVITTSHKTVCLNGAAARLAKAGDEILVSSFHHAGLVECAIGKIHRASVSSVSSNGFLTVDRVWLKHAGIEHGQVVTVVNVSNGKRDTVYVEQGGKDVCKVGVRGYNIGDLVIVMAYAWVSLEDLKNGNVPDMKIYFCKETM